MAHARGMKVLADEAHGTHLYFGKNLPVSAMEAGADMAAVSMHKSGGSLTQSSLLLLNKGVNADYVRQIINLTQTTSASYLLLSSLDISRRNLALRGEQSFARVVEMAEYARQEINSIGGYYAYGKELVNGNSIFDYDVTKLSIYTRDIGLAGIEVYDLLRDEYDIQIEFGDISNILAYISIGDRSRISSGWWGRWRISSGSTARTAPGSFPASIFRPRWSCRLRRRSIRTRFRSRWRNPPGGSAPSLSCAIRRGSRS